jgi:hypothetical protein
MRPVSGFERPVVQWIYVAMGILLIGVAAAEAVALRRARIEIESLHGADLNARLERQRLESRLAHERAAADALTVELARARGGTATSSAEPTLTLAPLTSRGAQPPDASVVRPEPAQPIQLRLLLPPGRMAPATRYTIAVRTWSGGDMLWQRSGLAASTADGKPMVVTSVMGEVFGPGAYEVGLTSTAGGEIASYELAVRAPATR